MTDTNNKQTYAQLKELVDQSAEQTQAITVVQFACASLDLMMANPSLKDQYIADYMKSADILFLQLKAARSAGNEKADSYLTICKSMLDGSFVGSGAADSQTIQKMYASKIDENKTNIAYLREVIELFKKLRCQHINAYFAALGYAYGLEPSADIAAQLGQQALRNEDYDTAISFFEQAAGMEADNNTKADHYYTKASLLYYQRKYTQARDACRKALELNPAYGGAYVLIGKMYADTARVVYPDDTVLIKAVYYAAIDKFEKGKQVDPTIAAEANSLIWTYSSHLPSNEEVFFHPDLEKGRPFMIGGWINERTTIR